MSQGEVGGFSRTAPRVVVVLGPTASGKSALAMGLALSLAGEIVSADSMQVYRGLDIGTAKPGPAERAKVPHHLIDLVDPQESFSVAQYQWLARSAIAEIHRRGHLPIVCGGTGLYVRALLYDYDFSAPGADPKFRAELAATARSEGTGELMRQLTEVDPVAAARIHPNDERRLIRALEVWRLTGKPISAGWTDLQSQYDVVKIGLSLARGELNRRIDERVDAMLAAGLAAEVARLIDLGYTRALVAGQALGYKEMVGALAGRMSLAAATAAIKQATRQYAKRQMTWFRRERGVQWLAGPGEVGGPVLEAALALIDAHWPRPGQELARHQAWSARRGGQFDTGPDVRDNCSGCSLEGDAGAF